MRNVTRRNKIAYAAFATIIGLVVVGLSFVVVSAITDNQNTYKAKTGDIGFSSDYQVKSLKKGTKVKKYWNGKFYYSEDTGEGKIELGNKNIIFNASRSDIVNLGDCFKVNNDESVDEIRSLTSIGDLVTPSIYKLDDRKYLMTGYEIASENAPATNNFVEVIIDKGGNALLINDKVNFKTLEPTVLQSGQLRFDIANEKLVIGEKEIDLKKVVGSTNVFKPTEEQKETEEVGTGTTAQGQTIIYSGGGGAGGVGGAGGESGTEGDENSKVDFSGYNNVGLTAIIPGTTAATVAYKINDITNAYPTVFLSVKDDRNNTRELTLEKSQTDQLISGLSPNSFYNVSLGYTEYVSVGGVKTLVTKIKDSIRFQTKPIKVNIKITKLTSKNVYYTVKLEKDFVIDSGNIKMLLNGNSAVDATGAEAPFEAIINVAAAKTEEGWSSKMPRPAKGGMILSLVTLEIRDVIYNKNPIKVEDKAYSLI